jgi:hypothetical protein
MRFPLGSLVSGLVAIKMADNAGGFDTVPGGTANSLAILVIDPCQQSGLAIVVFEC